MMTPDQIQFISENYEVTISLSIKMDALRFMGGIYGPFQPLSKTQVPLWLAMFLKKFEKCSIEPPDWLYENTLTEMLELNDFSRLPFEYLEIAHILLSGAREDIKNADEIEILIQDVYETRKHKSRTSFKTMDFNYNKINNMGSMELNEFRPFLTSSFNLMNKLEQEQAEDGANYNEEQMDYLPDAGEDEY